MINQSPYNIYVRKRPIKIAYLINPKETTFEEIDLIFEFNMSIWGGRYNPIVKTDGNSINKSEWELLCNFDPDVIKSLVALDDDLIKQIDLSLAPYSIEVPKKTKKKAEKSLRIDSNPISIYPTPQNITLVYNSYFDETDLVIFDIKKVEHEIIAKFIHRNLGTYPFNVWDRRLTEKVNPKTFTISDKKSLSLAFEQLSTFTRFVYPIQLCSLSDYLLDGEYDRQADLFTVVVGDSFEEIIYTWNRGTILSKTQQSGLNQIWLPTELATDKELQEGLKKWLNRLADPFGTENKEIRFLSFSLQKNQLNKISEDLTKDVWLRKTVSVFDEPPPPPKFSIYPLLNLESNLDQYRVTSDHEQLILKEPEIEEKFMRGEQWMADLYIELSSRKFQHIIGGRRWWQLPNCIDLVHYMFRRTGKIAKNGIPSVLLNRGSPKVTIRLLDEYSLFHSLILSGNFTERKFDPRAKLKYNSFDDINFSDKGKYLSGLLKLFTELHEAYSLLKNSYWRRVFNILSCQKPETDEKKRATVKNKLRKKIEKSDWELKNNPDSLDWLSTYVLQLSREISTEGKELPYKFFVEEAKKELEAYTSLTNDDRFSDLNEDDVYEAIYDLIELNILHCGIKTRCMKCGTSNWHHINEAKEILQCNGCRHLYPIPPEPEWHYRLNSLVQQACAHHGLIPVILVLGQLLERCRSSFFYIPSIEVFKKRGDDPFGDIDIVCIQDGKFIIGEVKQSIKLFKSSDFDKTYEIAELVRPDLVLFSSLDPKPTRFVENQIKALEARLSPLNISVQWYQLRGDTFEPSPQF